MNYEQVPENYGSMLLLDRSEVAPVHGVVLFRYRHTANALFCLFFSLFPSFFLYLFLFNFYLKINVEALSTNRIGIHRTLFDCV
jgi:hypothetical protein